MIARLSILVLGSAPFVLAAQAPTRSTVGFEAMGGIARFTESFTSDCCGPKRTATGSSFGVRIGQGGGRRATLALEGGATFAAGRSMKWLMPVFALAVPKGLTPWIALGAGLMAQPGECPADAPDTSPDCKTQLGLGWVVDAGLRHPLKGHLAISLEASLVRGAAHRERRFTAQRIGLGLHLD